jgi:YbbR domain-containing protein
VSWLVREWPLKLLAVAIAATTWVVVVSRDRGPIAAVVPIEYVGLPPGLVLTAIPRDTAEVQLAVARWALGHFRPEALRLRVDLRGSDEGERMVALRAADVEAPPGVRVGRVAPARVRVDLARVSEATLRVVPVVRGVPAPGHRVAGVRVDPKAVQVKGPRSTIEARDSVQTAPVDVGGSRSSVSRSVTLALPDAVSPLTNDRVYVTVDSQAAESARLHREDAGK